MSQDQPEGSLFSVAVEGLAYGGAGVGRVAGRAVFIPGAYPGDTVLAKAEKDKKSYVEAAVVRIIAPSPSRVEPACIYAGDCGGCPWMGLEYGAQMDWKRAIVREQLRRIGGLSVDVAPVVPSIPRIGYRARARMKVSAKRGKVLAGFRKAGSHHSIAAVDECVVCNAILNTALKEIRQYLRSNASAAEPIYEMEIETGPPGSTARITFNTLSPLDPEFMKEALSACPSVTGATARHKGSLKSYGDTELSTETGFGIRLFFDPGVFSQINPAINKKMVERIAELAGPPQGRTAIDLYCGMGNIAIPLASAGFGVTGVESVKQAVENADANRNRLGLFNANFIHADAAREAQAMADRGLSFDVTILDPPKGGAKGLAGAVSRITRERLVYVSCDPPALARDAKEFVSSGFELESVEAFDMFPQTARVEVVAAFRRR